MYVNSASLSLVNMPIALVFSLASCSVRNAAYPSYNVCVDVESSFSSLVAHLSHSDMLPSGLMNDDELLSLLLSLSLDVSVLDVALPSVIYSFSISISRVAI